MALPEASKPANDQVGAILGVRDTKLELPIAVVSKSSHVIKLVTIPVVLYGIPSVQWVRYIRNSHLIYHRRFPAPS
jgi:hypothetical protein